MFGKKKKKTNTKTNKSNSNQQLSAFGQKADELRKAVLAANKKCQRILAKHDIEISRVTDKEKKIKIDNKYGGALLSAEHESGAAWDNYSRLIRSKFTEEEILQAGAQYGKFMEKSFIKNLDKLAKKK